jgi:hypothetical protein
VGFLCKRGRTRTGQQEGEQRMVMFGSLWVPDELLAGEYALDLLSAYFCRDDDGYVYSGAVFDSYPADPLSGDAVSCDTANVVTGSDLVALSLLGIRVTGYEALIITQYRAQEIGDLLGSIPADARIEEEASAALLTRDGPAWQLWKLLYEIKDRTREARFGAVAAGKLLARKRPDLIPIEDSQIAGVFRRKAPDRDEHWWDDVRTAALDTQLTANGNTLWGHLARLRGEAGADHLPVLRILDIIGWMHARRSPAAGA